MALGVSKRSVEYLVYLIFWGVLLMSPFIGDIINGTAFTYEWDHVFTYWIYLIPIAILFILNNNVFMPFLLYKKKGRYYLLYILCIVTACCLVYIFSPEAGKPFGKDKPGDRHFMERRPPHHRIGDVLNEKVPRGPREEVLPFYHGRQRTVHDQYFDENVYEVRRRPKDGDRRVLMMFSNPGSMQVLLAIFVLVFNICIRLSFFTLYREKLFNELEKEKAKTELDYLKYQINPHFFMNTLNNIHALIEIDKDEAQNSVLKLSKMMRYVLYDATSRLVPLEKEIVFLKSYIDLMRLRYTSNLVINFGFSGNVAGVQIPSLLLVIFVENAFKHGVTYKHKSFIDVDIFVDSINSELVFTCRNTINRKKEKLGKENPGIGVENARKRLKLIYGDNARLSIKSEEDNYNVELKIPLSHDKMHYC